MIGKFSKNRDGSIAILSGLLFIPILLACGIAVDHSRGQKARSDLQRSTDAAALALLRKDGASQTELNAAAFQMVNANLSRDLKFKTLEVNALRDETGKVEVDANMAINTYFMQIIGNPSLNVSTQSTAAQGAVGNLDIHILIDRSASMMIGDTQQDIYDLLDISKPMMEAAGGWPIAWEPEGCAFACHKAESWETDGDTMRVHATDNGITLREARVDAAAADMVSTLLGEAGGNVRIGVTHFSNTANTILAPSTDSAAVSTALLAEPTEMTRDTRYDALFAHLEENFAAQGDGSLESPTVLFVLVTDGMRSHWRVDPGWEGVGDWGAFDGTMCDELKNRGYGFAVVNTVYDPVENSGRYDVYVRDLEGQLDDGLKTCATDGYFEGARGSEIDAAFSELRASIAFQMKPRLTN